MEQLEKFELNKKRDFGAILQAAFTFIKLNKSSLLYGFLYYVIPINLLGTVLSILIGGNIINRFDVGTQMNFQNIASTGIFYLFFILSYSVLYGIVFSTFIQSDKSETGVTTYEEVKPIILTTFFKVLLFNFMFILMILPIFVIYGLLASVSMVLFGVVFFFSMFILIYFMIPLSLAPYVFVKEGLPFIQTLKRTFSLVAENWWMTFLILFVAGLLTGLISSVVTVPVALITMFFSLGEIGAENSQYGVWLGTTLLLISSLASLFVAIYTMSVIVFKYYDLLEKKEGGNLKSKISTIGDVKDSIFENEGDY